MKVKFKKNVAREFLFLLGSTVLFFVLLFLWMFFENRNDNRVDELQNEIKSTRLELVNKIKSMEKKGELEKTIANMVQKSEENKKLTKLEEELKKKENSFFSSSIYDKDVIELGILIISITFGLRYLIYATKWSLKELKSENNE